MSDEDGRKPPSLTDDPELTRRLDELGRKLEDKRPPEPKDDGKSRAGAALAMRLASDFVAGILLGAALGWGFDRLFGTSPWGLVVLLLLGFAAGVLSVLRSAGLVTPGPTGPDDMGDRI